MSKFNDFRFEGLDMWECSNKYMTMKRVSADENKIVVLVNNSHLRKTKFGYALILDRNHVVFLKEWQVERSYFTAEWDGSEVLLTRRYWNVKEWGEFEEFMHDDEPLSFDHWLKTAKEQIVEVRWSK